MSQQFIIHLGREVFFTAVLVASPMLIAGLIVGVTISIIQTATSIQEQTLTFIPKIVAVVISLILFMPWMMNTLLDFSINLLTNIPDYIK
ncbi:MAG: EscS/YscS/HrcS family type III secretion system export apparatus protein [Candidatus Glassbacteria bacterium RIFCSPLOWO2_12_FULL_58_11]|uniref:Flagellar biosynthetic protein FliQ n=2 Tax=Candidatus Glassiibacteriota TaxID=1817805 RepID=A0A1F5YKS3_9BACT|nr:MAG: EscS/YscS/HrcS family type III secretion system export apparatus protein [Candidatus Glassbacteria bacterium GWA2_58_10]OGG00819.1 MAG: EscS/YscS/HrcS family type III secretion system export apparatus protein [Candidatus Glassbacteria bacterium RIFCSPLOWO2_12_FULL_58_11]